MKTSVTASEASSQMASVTRRAEIRLTPVDTNRSAEGLLDGSSAVAANRQSQIVTLAV
jgi:hypothetical protein